MRLKTWQRVTALVVVCGVAAGLVVSRLYAVPGGTRQAAQSTPMVAVSLPTQPPKGATMLFAGKEEQLRENWVKRYTSDPSNWTVDQNGAATPQKSDLTSKQEYGDCFVHVEFR